MAPDNHGKNRNSFAFVISNRYPFPLFIHLLMCTHLNNRTLGSCPQQIPALLSCSLLWVGGDSILRHCVCSVPFTLPCTAQAHSQQSLSRYEGGIWLCLVSGGPSPLSIFWRHTAPATCPWLQPR